MQPSLANPQGGGGENKYTDATLLHPTISNLAFRSHRERSSECSPYRLASQDTEHDREGERVSLEGQMKDFQPR